MHFCRVSVYTHTHNSLLICGWFAQDRDTLELHSRGGKTSKLLGQEHHSQHIASLSLARVDSFECKKVPKVRVREQLIPSAVPADPPG